MKITSPSSQLDFLLALFTPLITVEQACFLLDDCDWHKIDQLLDSGRIRGVDIRSGQAEKRCIRIYRYTVEHLILRPSVPIFHIGINQMMPHERPTILRRELARMINATEQHISNLNLPGPRGRHDTRHRIYRDAVCEFLNEREIKP